MIWAGRILVDVSRTNGYFTRPVLSTGWGVPACWVKEREVKTHTPIGSVAWSVGIVFAADLDADRLLSNL